MEEGCGVCSPAIRLPGWGAAGQPREGGGGSDRCLTAGEGVGVGEGRAAPPSDCRGLGGGGAAKGRGGGGLA